MNQQGREFAKLLAKQARVFGQSAGTGRGTNSNFGAGPSGIGKALGGASGLLLLGGAAITLNSALFNVDGGHRAIKYTRIHGVKPDVYGEGTHFVIPWFETPIIYDVRAKPRTIASLTGTKGIKHCEI
ncbi:hypothetical protein VP01_433g12 [Puccinia sorghi]|uniref:Prohibitin n=1 Tax=Puccinia sorghi TaxID=27349 RepID=A0A0L6UPW6_9BASI|nr:hypothetical protein VP01_433g12 [Puccinia sorghi]